MEDGRGDRYDYDDEGQLTAASYRVATPEATPGTALRTDVFEYDKLGNRMGTHNIASRGSTNFTRDNNGLNQYSSWTPSAINYDDDMGGDCGSPGHANGVTMQEGYITASFNALNQPTAMWSPVYNPNFLWFGYDPLGRCVKRWMGSDTGYAPNSNPATYYYYDGQNMIQEGSSAINAARIYVHGAGVDQVVASQVSSGEWRYHHYDGQGNCILLTDTGGAIREQYDYDAFGMPYAYSVGGTPLGTAGPWGNRFLFTGREWLSDLRIYDYRARQYQPELGRFLQPDPQEFSAGDYNLYRYCHNDPVNKSDPTGLAERIMEDFRWKTNCFFDGGNSFQGSYAEFKARANLETMPTGNYADSNVQNHIKKDQKQEGLTVYSTNVEGGVSRPTLNWYVNDERYASTKVVLGELEHVSRYLWSSEAGRDLAEAVRKFNKNPNADKAKEKLENARLKEKIWHDQNIHDNRRHIINSNPKLRDNVHPLDIQKAIRSVEPLEDPRPAYLGY
jgi:RHS repeat-associated protein